MMEFDPINLFNAIVLILMLAPNIMFWRMAKSRENTEKFDNKAVILFEQIGRYACMLLMIFPIGVWKFGFGSVMAMVVYALQNTVLLVSYIAVWMFSFKKMTLSKAVALSVIPTVIFLANGIILKHWLLVAASVVFGAAHITVTWRNNAR